MNYKKIGKKNNLKYLNGQCGFYIKQEFYTSENFLLIC